VFAATCAIITAMIFGPTSARAQTSAGAVTQGVTLTVRVAHAEGPVAGAVIRAGRVGALTDSAGTAALHLPAGRSTLTVSRAGFRPETLAVTLRPATDTTIAVRLVAEGTALAPVVVTSTRGARRLEEEPERVEILSGEDVGEKTVMRPANPTTLLSELPGVRVQTTAPALGGAGIRIQGLRGRYTLLLTDGLPLYGSSSEGLGFLQIPPLDLAQAEVIKGAATALYGPAAAGGVLNLISRRPPRNGVRDRELLLNQTSQRGTDALLWSADRLSGRWGYTLLGGAHNQVARDVSGDGWADVPGFRRAEVRPRLFWSGRGGSSAMLTVGAADERRTAGAVGGPAWALATGTPPFRVAADTRRADVGIVVHAISRRGSLLSVRASANQQWQDRQFGDSAESDRRGTSFAEATLAHSSGAHQQHHLLVGAGVQHDALAAIRLPDATYSFVTSSLFGQDTYTASDRVSLSATARLDHQSRYGTFLSPRASALVRLAPGWTARASAGAGVFAPTPLVEASEVVGVARIRGFRSLTAERLRSASLDLTRTVGPLEINGTVFRSGITHAVVVRENAPTAPGTVTLTNAPTPTHTGGAEFFTAYNREPVAVTALYSYTRSTEWSPDKGRRIDAPLTPRHAAGVDVAFEEDESGTRVGLEVFYTGRQPVEDNPYRTMGRPYATVGLLGEQRIGPATVFVNAENLTNVRQTRFDPLLLPRRSVAGRWTTDAWAPLEGRTLNAGARFRF
jgi:iron complex outermembrane receptor protein